MRLTESTAGSANASLSAAQASMSLEKGSDTESDVALPFSCSFQIQCPVPVGCPSDHRRVPSQPHLTHVTLIPKVHIDVHHLHLQVSVLNSGSVSAVV